jgi:hypothetical protein
MPNTSDPWTLLVHGPNLVRERLGCGRGMVSRNYVLFRGRFVLRCVFVLNIWPGIGSEVESN